MTDREITFRFEGDISDIAGDIAALKALMAELGASTTDVDRRGSAMGRAFAAASRSMSTSLAGLAADLGKVVQSSGLMFRLLANPAGFSVALAGAAKLNNALLTLGNIAKALGVGGLLTGVGIALTAIGVKAAFMHKEVQKAGMALKKEFTAGIKSASKGLVAPMTAAIGQLRTELRGALPFVRQGFNAMRPIFNTFKNSVKGLGPIIGQTFRNLVIATRPFVQLLVRQIPKIVNWLHQLSVKARNNKGALTEFKAALQGVWAAIKAGIGFVRRVVAAMQAFRAWWDENGFVIEAIAKFVLGGIGQAFKGLFNVIKGVVELIAAIIQGDWSKAWEACKTIAKGAFDLIAGLAQVLIVGKLVKLVQLGVKGIIAAFKSLPGSLGSAGRAAMTGLWNGLKSVAGSILSWVKNFVSGIKNAITSALKIRSPSRVMFDIGENISKGLQLGIQSVKVPPPVMGQGVSPSTAKVGGQAMARRPTTTDRAINITINGALDPVAVGKQIEGVMLKYSRHTGRAARLA